MKQPIKIPIKQILASIMVVIILILFFVNQNPPIPEPACSDTIQNQDETDVDCGGALCPKCGAEKKCMSNEDCQQPFSCTAGICQFSYQEEELDCESFLDANNASADRINLVFVGVGYDEQSDFETDIIRALEFEPEEEDIPGLFGYEPFFSQIDKFNVWFVKEKAPLQAAEGDPFCFSLCQNDLAENHCLLPNRYIINLCNTDCLLSYILYESISVSNSEILPLEFTHAFGHVFAALGHSKEGVMAGIVDTEKLAIPLSFAREDEKQFERRLQEFKEEPVLGTTFRLVLDSNFSLLDAEEIPNSIMEKRSIGAGYGLRFATGSINYFMDFEKEEKVIVEDVLEGAAVLEEFSFPKELLVIALALKASKLEPGWKKVHLYNNHILPYQLVILDKAGGTVKTISAEEVATLWEE